MNPNPTALPLTPEDFDAIDAILDDLRSRFDETPQWEFCEGFMAALIVSRRVIAPSEYLPVLLDTGEATGDEAMGQGRLSMRNRWQVSWSCGPVAGTRSRRHWTLK